MTKKNTQGGFIHLMIMFAIFSVIVWYFKLDIRGYIDSHAELRDSLNGMIHFLKGVWKNYLEGAGAFIWNNVIIELIWNNLRTFIPAK
ncbi:MAG: hypothetical protein M0P76_01330 [Candidatus Pacebacteria bacterium]|jgi:hypothetical protein|nr:hypothetical protein [Candidatus Paceibacterota bacterium]